MTVAVRPSDGSHRLEGTWAGTESANAFLSHLETRRFSPATVRAYAFDIVCLARFLEERGIGLGDLVPTDVFDWIDWQSLPRRRDGKVVPIGAGRGAAPASVDGVFFTELAAYLRFPAEHHHRIRHSNFIWVNRLWEARLAEAV